MPLMVIVLAAQAAVTPAGKPAAVPMPVAPVVVWVMTGLSAVLIHSVGVEEGEPAVLLGVTVISALPLIVAVQLVADIVAPTV